MMSSRMVPTRTFYRTIEVCFSVNDCSFSVNVLDVRDLAVLSGAHTIKTSHCNSFSNKLYNFTEKQDTDPSLDKYYAAQLKIKCKAGDSKTIVEMDPGSFRTFDTHYYVNVKKNRVIFQYDVALLSNNEAEAYVNKELQGLSFFSDFATSMERWEKSVCSRALQTKSEDTALL